MSIFLVALMAAAVAQGAPPAGPAPADAEASPLVRFLRAADTNDFAAMRPLMARGSRPERFLGTIEGCYLRRVYGTPAAGEVMAAWMCAEGERRSRVVIATVATGPQNDVVVRIGREDRNAIAAPPRQGSALAD